MKAFCLECFIVSISYQEAVFMKIDFEVFSGVKADSLKQVKV